MSFQLPSAYDRLLNKPVFVRTATYHAAGILTEIFHEELVLVKASFISESGPYTEALKTGKFQNCSPIPNELIIAKGGIIDVTEIPTVEHVQVTR